MELFAAILARDMARVKSHAVYGGKAMTIATDRVSNYRGGQLHSIAGLS